MSIRVTVVLFFLFTLVWGYISGVEFLGTVLGDCLGNDRCSGIKDYAPGYVIWRWVAIQLVAVIVLIAVRKR